MDHSKNCNPKMPLESSVIEIEGVKFPLVSCLMDSGLFQVRDCRELHFLQFSDSEDSGRRSKSHSRNSNPKKKRTGNGDTSERVVKHKKRGKYSRNDQNEITDDSTGKRFERRRKRVHDYHHTSVSPMHKENENCRKRKMTESPKKYSDEGTIDISSDSSSQSKHKTQSSTPLSQQDVTVKEKAIQPAQELFGYYFCELCNLQLSSEKVYQEHMQGKRHFKALKLKNVPETVSRFIPPSVASEGQSRYPKPPHGVNRRKVKEYAKIQSVIENGVTKPCPGLHLVTEIQGIRETLYYCTICNSACSASSILPHLTGFKHQFMLVKHFKPGVYETLCCERRSEIQSQITNIVQALLRREGLGRMMVEREELDSYSKDIPSDIYQPSTSRDTPGTSFSDSGLSFSNYYNQASIPSTSAADFFCKYCDAHMNSEDAWTAHIAGKRHITNLKKLPGDQPSKTKTIPLHNVRAKLLNRLEKECPNEVIVGLDDIQEIQNKDTNSETYRCFLCTTYHTSLDIIQHLTSSKHRMKYLDHIQYSYKRMITDLNQTTAISSIEGICAKVEAKRGRGKPSVHLDKNSIY